ncbi:MAG: hypothetical protein GX279_10455 [Clostridiaceae bacterium]|nr:hypothetical protein [Clostridiaceae bacterium]
MNESLSEFLFNMAIVVFFVVAVTLYFIMNGFSNDMVDFIRNDISNQKEIIQIIEEKEELEVSGEEILSDILAGSFDNLKLTIDGVITEHTIDNPFEFDKYQYIDLNAWYTAEPVFDAGGNVTGMKYSKK